MQWHQEFVGTPVGEPIIRDLTITASTPKKEDTNNVPGAPGTEAKAGGHVDTGSPMDKEVSPAIEGPGSLR